MFCQIIVSAAKEVLSLENNILRDLEGMDRLNDLGFDYVPVIGMYEGKEEASYLINVETSERFDILKALFFGVFDQESVLVLRDLNAELLFKNGDVMDLGTFTEVTKSEAERNDAYTYMNRKYYICKQLTIAPEWGTCSQETKEAESEMLHSKDHPCFVTDGQLCEVEI